MKLLLIITFISCLFTVADCACAKPTIANGAVDPTGDTVATDATYTVTCTSGFHLTGTAAMTCGADTNFDATPTCDADMCTKPDVTNGVVTPADATLGVGEVYTVTCAIGYSGSGAMTCEAGEGFDAPITCAAICSLPTVTNGAVAPTDATVAVTGTYTITCDTGFHRSTGDGVMTCASSATFDIAAPTCEADMCTKPVVANGTVAPITATVAVDETYTITCDTGTVLTGGNGVMTCLAGMTLSHVDKFTCAGASFTFPAVVLLVLAAIANVM